MPRGFAPCLSCDIIRSATATRLEVVSEGHFAGTHHRHLRLRRQPSRRIPAGAHRLAGGGHGLRPVGQHRAPARPAIALPGGAVPAGGRPVHHRGDPARLHLHLAAQPIPALSRHDPWFTLENNIRAQLNVLEALRELRLASRVLVVGSSEEYGRVTPDDLPLDEDTPLRPAYALRGQQGRAGLSGLPIYSATASQAIRVRPFNHIGPRQRQGFVAPISPARSPRSRPGCGPPVMAVGTLDVARDFSDVRDIVRGYHLALTQGEPGEVYNLGSGQPASARQLLEMLIRLSGQADPRRAGSRPACARSSVPVIVADCRKLRARTGWQTEIPSSRACSDVLDYWREQVRTGASDPTPPGLPDKAYRDWTRD